MRNTRPPGRRPAAPPPRQDARRRGRTRPGSDVDASIPRCRPPWCSGRAASTLSGPPASASRRGRRLWAAVRFTALMDDPFLPKLLREFRDDDAGHGAAAHRHRHHQRAVDQLRVVVLAQREPQHPP